MHDVLMSIHTAFVATIAMSTRRILPVRDGPVGKLELPRNSGCISYEPSFLTAEESESLFNDCVDAKSWQRTPILFFGKMVMQPRDTAFFGTRFYSYSGERRMPVGWNDDPPASNAICALGRRIEKFLDLPENYFNVVLANKYLNSRDGMGYHADNEKSLGPEPIIASISVGAVRKFVVRPKKSFEMGASPCKYAYNLKNGSLLVMSGKTQTYYEHAIPKVALSKNIGVRLNFTFRHVVDADADK